MNYLNQNSMNYLIHHNQKNYTTINQNINNNH
jgi:hypothetical protein